MASDDEWTLEESQALGESAAVTDCESIGTEESQWLVLENDETDCASEADLLQAAELRAKQIQQEAGSDSDDELIEPAASEASESSSEFTLLMQGEVVSTEEELVKIEELIAAVPAPKKPVPVVSAALLTMSPLQICGAGAWECHECRGDMTAQWAPALAGFPEVAGAVCLGRIVADVASPVLVLARVAVLNNGNCDWPEATALRLTAGDALGFPALPIGAVPVGQGAELTLDLRTFTPPDVVPGVGRRSAWVLEDGLGRPFGPLLIMEVVWM